MIKFIPFIIILCCNLVVAKPYFDSNKREHESEGIFVYNLQSFVSNNFHNDVLSVKFKLSRDEASQLTWLGDTNKSFMHKVVTYSERFNKELHRVLTRLYCLHLLRVNTKLAYKFFIETQSYNSKALYNLKYENFKKMAYEICSLPKGQYSALRVFTITQSLSQSKEAWDRASKLFGKKNLPVDMVDFMYFTVKKPVIIYPLLNKFLKNNKSMKKICYLSFDPKLHLRHMVFVECGVNIFSGIREKIKYNKMSKFDMDFWYYFWMVNTFGFYGHKDNRGSLSVDQAMHANFENMRYQLKQMFSNPNYNPLIPYLKYRAGLLGLKLQPDTVKQDMVLAKLAAMLRLNETKGKELLSTFLKLPKSLQQNFIIEVYAWLTEYDFLSPSYAPMVLDNCYLHANKDLFSAIKIFLPLYTSSLKEYRSLVARGIIDKRVRLNFYNLSFKANTSSIFKNYTSYKRVKFNIKSNGMIELVG